MDTLKLKYLEELKMIKENELKSIDNASYRLSGDDSNISLDKMKSLLISANSENYRLPIKITKDEIKSGGLFNSKTEECLIIQNTQKTGYFTYCITMRKQINTLLVSLCYFGASLLTAEYELAEARKNGPIFAKAINAIKGFDQSAFDEEYAYYGMLKETFASLFN